MAIKICDKCEGVGEICFDVGTHKAETEYARCSKCKGTGRLVIETHIKTSAFDPKKAEPTKIF